MNYENNKKKVATAFFLLAVLLIYLIAEKTQAADFLKTVKFYIFQSTGTIADGTTTNQNFTISIAESSPQIKSAFIEIKGIAKGSAPGIGTLNVKVSSQPYSPYNIEVAVSPKKFSAKHDITALASADFPGIPGSKEYALSVQNIGFAASGLSVKLILTYEYSEISGTLPAFGYVISSTVDTGIAKGAAYNSLIWQGNLNGGEIGQVGLQVATSDFDSGPWVFKGPNCLAGVNYNTDTDTPIEITCVEHNNKRYFRYKVIICSNADCSTSGNINPTVNGVAVNWAP